MFYFDNEFIIRKGDITQDIANKLGLTSEECKRISSSVWTQIIDEFNDEHNINIQNNCDPIPDADNNHVVPENAVVTFSKECWSKIVTLINNALGKNKQIEETEGKIEQEINSSSNESNISAFVNNILSLNNQKYANKQKELINGQYYTFDNEGKITHIYNDDYDDSLSTVIVYYEGKPQSIYKYDREKNKVLTYNENCEHTGYMYVDEDAAYVLAYQYSRDAILFGMLDKSLTLDKIKSILENEDPINIMHGYLDANGREDIGQEFKHSLLEDIASFDGGMELVNNIIQNKIQEANDKNVNINDIIRDINSHPEDYKKLDIDLLRLQGRIDYEKSDGSDIVDISTLDRKLSDNISQNNATDDCFLVSSMIATSANSLWDELQTTLRTDLPNGDIQIKMANNKVYTITQEELVNANYLSNGDLDMRVYEIALDRYRRDMAYENPIGKGCSGYGINGGGFFSDVSMAFFGVNTKKVTDIENKNSAYVFGFNPCISDEVTQKAFDKNGKEVGLDTRHTYAVKYFDQEYAYFVDPYNSSDLLHIRKEDLYNAGNVEIEELDLLEVKNKIKNS